MGIYSRFEHHDIRIWNSSQKYTSFLIYHFTFANLDFETEQKILNLHGSPIAMNLQAGAMDSEGCECAQALNQGVYTD